MTYTLLLGTGKVDITPSYPVPLAGFAVRHGLGPFTEVAHPLYARIFIIESQDNREEAAAEGRLSRKRAVVVSADIIWWGSDRTTDLKWKISECCGVDPGSILLHGTHTHSGPQTSGLFTSYLGMPDAGYLNELEDRVLHGVRTAAANLEPVRIERGTGYSGLAINRRGLRLSPPEIRLTDHELNVIRFVQKDGVPKAVFVHYACHPVITNENKISSEFVGVAMEAVEERYGNGLVCGFLQGTCGDLNPGDGSSVIRGTDDRVVEVGMAFAEDVMRTLNGPMLELAPCSVAQRSRSIELPLIAVPDPDTPGRESLLPVLEEWRRIQRINQTNRQQTVTMELTLLKIAENCSVVAMNAEVVTEYGLYVKRLSGGQALPIGYTNGMFGYVPTAAQLMEGGYEADESVYYFAMPSAFAPEVETILKLELEALLHEDSKLNESRKAL